MLFATFVWVLILGIITAVCIYILTNHKKQVEPKQLDYDGQEKNGIPIIPRGQRQFTIPDNLKENDIKDKTQEQQIDNKNSQKTAANLEKETVSQWQMSSSDDGNETLILDNKSESDAFSSLVSATENILPTIDVVDEPKLTMNSPIIDQHLTAQYSKDQDSPIKHAKETINIYIIPNNKFNIIRGSVLLNFVEKYGLKYGVMNMFHRYKNSDGTGIMWFSMMGMSFDEGVIPFDLNALPISQFSGLSLFICLPHPTALQGFDSMMSIAGMMAKELDASIRDEEGNIITSEYKQRLRRQVQEYR